MSNIENQNLKDKKAREKISNVLDKSFFVEAGAGSGKTHCLVDRMVNLIKKGAARIENIAAVTFTRKAAAELQERFQIKLEKSFKSSNAREKENIKIALSNLEQIFIGTIHSFCSKLLRERPVEAGIDPGFEEIEEEDDLLYAESAWASFIESEEITRNTIFSFIREIGIKPDDIKDTFLKLVGYPDVDIVKKEVKKPDFKDIKKSIIKFIEFFNGKLPGTAPSSGWDDLQNIIIRTRNYINTGYLKEDRLFIILLKQMNKNPRITQNRWPDGNSKQYQQMMIDFQEETIKPALLKWAEYVHKPLISFAEKGAKYYENWRKDHSILNFEDLLMKSAKLLRDNLEIRKYFKKMFTHILVDEFQDTDPIQAELIMFLVGNNNGSDWKKLSPKPGALFVVGDPKQSIYRFRRADIDIYNLVKSKFLKDDGVLELNSNFRSLPFVEEVVEKTFKAIFPKDQTRYQAKFFPLSTVNKDLKEDCNSGVLENPIEKIERGYAHKVAEEDAKRIAIWIKEAADGSLKLQRTDNEIRMGLTEKVNYSDFLILTKGKKRLSLYAEALELYGIAYDISGSESFANSEELREIYRLLKAVEDDRDPVSLITALRGIFFGISDNMLYKFKKAGGRFSYFSKAPAGFLKISGAFERLKEYRKIVNRYSPATAAEKIIEKSGIIPLGLSEEKGLTRVGNIFKGIDYLKKFKADKIGTFSDLTLNLKELLDSKEIESANLSLSDRNTVRIMNLHKAKGLEAPIVILADPMGEPKEWAPELHISRAEDNKAKGYFTIIKRNNNYNPEVIGISTNWEEKSEEEKRYEDAERRRLEYVAITRAKNILVVSTYRHGSRAKAWEFLYDYLQDAPKIEIKGEFEAKGRNVFSVSKDEWQSEKERISAGIENIKKDSYKQTNVTTEAKEGMIFSEGIVGGMSWGKIVHKAVEMVCRGRYEKMKVMAGKWLEEEGRPTEEADKLIGVIRRFMDSDLWGRIDNAGEKYFEVPFALKEAGSIVLGVIDLVFKEDGRWVIMDYKTDDFEKDEVKKKAYEKQVGLYKKYWEEISGEKVKEKFLFRL